VRSRAGARFNFLWGLVVVAINQDQHEDGNAEVDSADKKWMVVRESCACSMLAAPAGGGGGSFFTRELVLHRLSLPLCGCV